MIPQRSAPSKESVVSLLLLGILILIVFMVTFGGRGKKNPELFPGTFQQQLSASYGLPSGWKLQKKWEVYPSERLYEKINGRAELFQKHGVIRLDFATATFHNFSFDIYSYIMKDAGAALGVYLEELPGEFKEIKIGSRADIAGGMVRVYQGDHYLVLIPLDRESDDALAIKLAESIIKSIAKEDPGSESISELFPQSGLLKGTISFNRNESFGLKSLNNTFSANYEIDGIKFYYLLRESLPGESAGILKSLEKELNEFGADILTSESHKLAGEIFGNCIMLEARENLLCGIYTELPPEEANHYLQKLLTSI